MSKLRLLSVVGGDDEEAREQGRPGDDGGGPNASEDVVSAPHEHDHLSVGTWRRATSAMNLDSILTKPSIFTSIASSLYPDILNKSQIVYLRLSLRLETCLSQSFFCGEALLRACSRTLARCIDVLRPGLSRHGGGAWYGA